MTSSTHLRRAGVVTILNQAYISLWSVPLRRNKTMATLCARNNKSLLTTRNKPFKKKSYKVPVHEEYFPDNEVEEVEDGEEVGVASVTIHTTSTLSTSHFESLNENNNYSHKCLMT